MARSKKNIEAGLCHKGLHSWVDGQKQCKRCKKAAASRHYKDNTEYYRALSRNWRKENPERQAELALDWHLDSEYGLTLDQYNEMLAKQNGVCAICLEPRKTGARLSVDHSHESNSIRGLLCRSCNMSLGGFKDSLNLLQAAIDYLESNG